MSSLPQFPCSLPSTPIAQNVDAESIASQFRSKLENLTAESFTNDAVWKDIFAVTGTIRTFYSSATIATIWKELSKKAKAGSFVLNPMSVRVSRLPGGSSWVDAMYSFETTAVPPTTCSAIVGLTPDADGNWKIWVMRTIIEQLQGQANVDELCPKIPTSFANDHMEATHFDCIVIGGGQAGLSMGGRLKAMSLTYAVLDKFQTVGDSWKSRYDSAKPHLAFDRTFPDTYPEWLSKDDLARGYQAWVAKYDINVWTSTRVTKGTWNAAEKSWTLEVERENSVKSITCSHVVLAGGGAGRKPRMPDIPAKETFKGEVLHSAEYKNASRWKGKNCIIIGAANTAHDVAGDMLDAGCASITMIQRSKTYVLPQTHYKRTADMLYNTIIPTAMADRAFLTQPYAVASLVSEKVFHPMAAAEPERYEALARAGFKVDPFGSITYQLHGKSGGNYLDVGVSAQIAAGSIKVKSDALPTAFDRTSLVMSDGTRLPADVVVFATGFNSNMRYMAEDIFGTEVAEKMGDYWGLDKWGEIKGAYKPGGQPGIWYHGGGIGHARYMSRFIALSIKAQMIGTPLEVYKGMP